MTESAWNHIRSEHPELAPFEAAIMQTVTSPSVRSLDARPGRERYFAEEMGPSRYLCVVVEFGAGGGEVVTAFGLRRRR